MKAPELYAAIRKLVLQAQSRRTWQRAVKIAERFGKKNTRQGSDYTTDTYELSVRVGTIWLKVVKSEYRYGGEYVLIDTTDGRVFDAKEVVREPLSDLECIKSFYIVERPGKKTPAPRRILVDGYEPGPWEDALNEERVADALRQAAAKVRAQEELKLVEAQRNRPLTEEERAVAKAFGLD